MDSHLYGVLKRQAQGSAACSNGGVRVNIGCTSDLHCRLYNPTYLCVDTCCCTQPLETETPVLFLESAFDALYDPVYDVPKHSPHSCISLFLMVSCALRTLLFLG
uniref:GPI-anchor transamidase n=1 Tax=Steinernema glaseri TaxID=37863 RepID=A0A1I7Z1J2_9BILA